MALLFVGVDDVFDRSTIILNDVGKCVCYGKLNVDVLNNIPSE